MEWAGSKKIIKYGLIWLLAVTICTAGIFCTALHEESVKRAQLEVLISKHPELEGDIVSILKSPTDSFFVEPVHKGSEVDIFADKYGYKFTKGIISSELAIFWGLLLLCITLGLIILYVKDRRIKKSRRFQNEKVLNFISEELSNFKRGEYQISSEVLEELDTEKLPEKWQWIVENIRELGSYLTDFKMAYEEEENNTKSLITDISHQLKTPLASLKMSHELVMAGTLTEEERKEFQEQEKQEIEKIELLLDELVKLSRLEHHMIEMSPVKQDIKETVAGAVSQVYGKAKGRQIEIQVDVDETPAILHDRKWTAEALSNVLDNAIKYSEEQSTIFLRVKQLTTNVLIEIEDSGMGIETQELHQIFKRFYRGKKAEELVSDGVGVGLYLTRMILEQQSGTIMAKRKNGGGSIFLITLQL